MFPKLDHLNKQRKLMCVDVCSVIVYRKNCKCHSSSAQRCSTLAAAATATAVAADAKSYQNHFNNSRFMLKHTINFLFLLLK